MSDLEPERDEQTELVDDDSEGHQRASEEARAKRDADRDAQREDGHPHRHRGLGQPDETGPEVDEPELDEGDVVVVAGHHERDEQHVPERRRPPAFAYVSDELHVGRRITSC